MILYVYRISALCCFQCSFPCPPDRFPEKNCFRFFPNRLSPCGSSHVRREALFSFSSANFYSLPQPQGLVNYFFIFLPDVYRCFALSRVSFYILPTGLQTVNHFSSIFLFFSSISFSASYSASEGRFSRQKRRGLSELYR